MFTRGSDEKAVLAALGKSQAIIEFDLTGKVISANENFCRALGYDFAEIQGRHHSMFVEPSYSNSADYREFWARLGRGEFDRRQYKRIAKGGREIWIEASYNPVFANGQALQSHKIATDVTAQKVKSMEDAGKLAALSRSQAVIEFSPSGEVLTANDNFCSALGYQLSEIAGKHHSMFCDSGYANSPSYRQFWIDLAAGRFQSDEFKRIGRGGKEIWIQATYNPIFDEQGKVFRVVKFATDITGRVHAVEALASGLQALANGDLEQRISLSFPANLEKLRTDFNESIGRLQEALGEIGTCASAIGSAADQVRSGADDLSKRTEQQAASVEETAAALDEITTTSADSQSPRGGGRSDGRRDPRQRRALGTGGQGSHRRHGRHRALLQRDRQHHRRHRRDRLPDQLAGAQCRCRGQRAPVTPAAALRSSRRKFASWHSARPRPPRRSRA